MPVCDEFYTLKAKTYIKGKWFWQWASIFISHNWISSYDVKLGQSLYSHSQELNWLYWKRLLGKSFFEPFVVVIMNWQLPRLFYASWYWFQVSSCYKAHLSMGRFSCRGWHLIQTPMLAILFVINIITYPFFSHILHSNSSFPFLHSSQSLPTATPSPDAVLYNENHFT